MRSNDKNNNKVVVRLAGVAAVLVIGGAATAGFAQTAVVALVAAVASPSGSDERVVQLSNKGAGTLNLGQPEFSPGFVRGSPVGRECGATLRPGEECNITIRFEPTQVGAQTGTLTLATSDPQHANLVVALSGTGVARPDRDDDGHHRDHDGDHDGSHGEEHDK